jgi:hypothetical protein
MILYMGMKILQKLKYVIYKMIRYMYGITEEDTYPIRRAYNYIILPRGCDVSKLPFWENI